VLSDLDLKLASVKLEKLGAIAYDSIIIPLREWILFSSSMPSPPKLDQSCGSYRGVYYNV
jgi:hypothetical protein